MLRHVACRIAMNDAAHAGGPIGSPEWSLRYVAGHAPDRSLHARPGGDVFARFSYLPIPALCAPHSDGRIRYAIIAEPFGGDGRAARWATRQLSGAVLVDEDLGPVARLEAVEPGSPQHAAALGPFLGGGAGRPGVVWVSATPVILPGFDDHSPRKRERLLAASLAHAGIDPGLKVSLDTSTTSWLRTIRVPPGGYHRPSYLRRLPALHVRVQLAHPIVGPLSLGAGRHAGLGVMAAIDHESPDRAADPC
jgi:CRISPR-associated protein Csb2